MVDIIENCVNGSTGVLVMFSMSEVAVSEAGGVVDLTVIKTGANSKDVFVTFSTLDGNAVGKTVCSSSVVVLATHLSKISRGDL